MRKYGSFGTFNLSNTITGHLLFWFAWNIMYDVRIVAYLVWRKKYRQMFVISLLEYFNDTKWTFFVGVKCKMFENISSWYLLLCSLYVAVLLYKPNLITSRIDLLTNFLKTSTCNFLLFHPHTSLNFTATLKPVNDLNSINVFATLRRT